MANERAWTYRNVGTLEKPVWERWFVKTLADAVFMDEKGDKTVTEYINEKIKELIGTAPENTIPSRNLHSISQIIKKLQMHWTRQSPRKQMQRTFSIKIRPRPR